MMAIAEWFAPPRRSLTAFLLLTLVLAAALAWLGWGVIDRDRRLEAQRTRERLDPVLDLAVVRLRERLTQIDQALSALATVDDAGVEEVGRRQAEHLADDGVVVTFRGDSVRAFPEGRLAYYPAAVVVSPSVDESAFADAERLEFRVRDYDGAAAAYATIAHSGDGQVRALALVRRAAALRKAGRGADALVVYDQLSRTAGAFINDVPVALVARHGRCATLEELSRPADLTREARALHDAILTAQWRISGAAYAYHIEAAERWMAQPVDAASAARARLGVALADATERLWDARQDPGGAPPARLRVQSGDIALLALTQGDAGQVAALVLGARALEHHVVSAVADLARQQGVELSLMDADGRVVFGRVPDGGVDRAVRAAAEAALPWTVYATLSPSSHLNVAAADRQRLIVTAGLVLGACVLTATWFTARAMYRELEVACLKSDFVAAVSHDFRTPLASFRQLSELLLDGRVAGDAERTEYYARLYRESRRLQRLVEHLLDFGRMECRRTGAGLRSRVRPVAAARSPSFWSGGTGVDSGVRADGFQWRMMRVAVDSGAVEFTGLDFQTLAAGLSGPKVAQAPPLSLDVSPDDSQVVLGAVRMPNVQVRVMENVIAQVSSKQ
jgi:signal transduction histidine kinase